MSQENLPGAPEEVSARNPLSLLVEIEAASKDYTPGSAYDTRWYEWTHELADIVRQLFRAPEDLARELELARPAIERAKERLRAERDLLAAVRAVWRHIDGESEMIPGRGLRRTTGVQDCTDPTCIDGCSKKRARCGNAIAQRTSNRLGQKSVYRTAAWPGTFRSVGSSGHDCETRIRECSFCRASLRSAARQRPPVRARCFASASR